MPNAIYPIKNLKNNPILHYNIMFKMQLGHNEFLKRLECYKQAYPTFDITSIVDNNYQEMTIHSLLFTDIEKISIVIDNVFSYFLLPTSFISRQVTLSGDDILSNNNGKPLTIKLSWAYDLLLQCNKYKVDSEGVRMLSYVFGSQIPAPTFGDILRCTKEIEKCSNISSPKYPFFVVIYNFIKDIYSDKETLKVLPFSTDFIGIEGKNIFENDTTLSIDDICTHRRYIIAPNPTGLSVIGRVNPYIFRQLVRNFSISHI